MPAFTYRVARTDGTTLEGQLEGENESTARAQLEGQGMCVLQLRQKGLWAATHSGQTRRTGKISLQDSLIFNQELVALIKAGLPILRVCDLLIERARQPRFRAVLEEVRKDIRGGASASDAMSRHPEHFPGLYIATIRAGEQAGNLPEVLQRYIQHLKLMIGLRQKMAKALAYPTVLLAASVGLVFFFLTFVIPIFMEIYRDSTKTLPLPTQMLLAIVETVQAYLMPGLIVSVGLGIACTIWVHSESGRRTWDHLLLKIPWVGETLMKHHTIQFTRSLATILSGGTPLVEGLQIARASLSNRSLSAGLHLATDQVRDGATLSASLGEQGVLPRLALEMVTVGEETGSLDQMLRDVAEFYEGDLDYRLNQMTSFVEMALLLFMGVVLGTLLVVMYLPIFEMAASV